MGNVTSDHIKPCNIGQSEAHNRRNPEYLARINKKNIYIRQDLSSRNESATTDAMNDGGLQAHYDALAVLVKEKTKRVMQTKVREVVDKRTGKVRKVNGSSPIRESVIVCREDTTIEQLKRYADECHKQFGITALQFHIHRDEGHYEDPEKKVWIPNYHAHIIWDWINHETGKSCKLNGDDTSAMQTLLADCLGMERGKSKSDTDATHLEREEFILAKLKREQAEIIEDKNSKASELAGIEKKINEQKAKVAQLQAEEERAKAKKQEAESSLEALAGQAQSKQNEIAELDKTITSKNKEANEAQADLLHQGMGALGAMAKNWVSGKAAAKDKETAEVKAENQRLIKERDEAVKKANSAENNAEAKYKQKYDADVKKLKESYDKQVDDAVKMRTAEKQKELVQMLDKINNMVSENSKLIRENDSMKLRINSRDEVLTILAVLLWNIIAVAIQAIKDLAFNKKISIMTQFSDEQAAELKGILNKFTSDPDKQKEVGYWLVREAEKRHHFTDAQFNQCIREIERVAENKYDIWHGVGRGI